MRRGVLIGTAAALALLLGSVPGLAEEPGQSRLFVVERTTDGPTYLELSASYGFDSVHGPSDGFAAFAAVRDDDEGIAAPGFGFIKSGGAEVWPWVYHNGERVDCWTLDPPAELCDHSAVFGGAGITMAYNDDGGPDDPTRIFVAVFGSSAGASVGERSRGWRLRELPPTFAFVHGHDAEATGVRGGLFGGAEVFLSAAAPGGEHGSVAVAQPPCNDPVWSPGAGVTQLLGGETEPLHLCPGNFSGVVDFAAGETAWRFEGAAAGASAFFQPTRLVVIDLPPPCDPDDEDEDCDEAAA